MSKTWREVFSFKDIVKKLFDMGALALIFFIASDFIFKTPELTGRWEFTTYPKFAKSKTLEVLQISFTVLLFQEGLKVKGIGEKIGAYCITEPQAGTDVASLACTAVLDGDSYVLNGTKTFVTNAGFAGVFIVFAKTDPEGGHRGISTFVVDSDAAGLTLGKPERKCGMKASDTREISLADVRVPKENLLGKEGEGFKMCVTILNSGRIGVAFQSIGIG